MPDIGLSSSYSAIVVLLALIAAALFSFLFHRRTVPPVSRPWRTVLGLIRFIVLFLLFYLLGEPLLSFLRTSTISPTVVVLVDDSKSMTVSTNTNVKETVSRIVRSDEMTSLGDRSNLVWATFSTSVHLLGEFPDDDMTFSGDRSDLTGALEWLRNNPPADILAACIVLSDGNSTSASNPVYAAEALGFPVFSVGIGDTTVRNDLLIADVLHNSIAYAGSRVPVQVTVRSYGYSEQQVEVTLSSGGSIVDRSSLMLSGRAGDHRTTLFMTPESVGTVRGSIAISRLGGETTYENNRSVFFTTVLSGKRRVLLLAGAPGEDVAFIRRALEADSNTTAIVRVERTDGTFLEGDLDRQLLGSVDALFLIGYPGPHTSSRSIEMLMGDDIIRRPVFFMLSRTIDPDRLRSINPRLPVTVESVLPSELSVFISVPEALRKHPILRLGEPSIWASLPPIFRPQGSFRVKPEAQVLASVRIQSQTLSDPLIAIRSVGGSRSIAFLGYGLWRWKMLSPQGARPDSPLDEFIGNSVRWLTAAEDQRSFRVTPSKQSFSALEPTIFRAEVYDETMRPVQDATVTMEISGGGRTYPVTFSSIDNGQYEGSGDMLPPGEYSYTATAHAGALELGTQRGTFTVGGLEAEFLETRLNADLLRNLAFRTGGAYFDGQNLTGLAGRITTLAGFGPEEEKSGIQIELAHSAWGLGLLVMLLSLEWFLRKRLGLL